MADRVAGLDAGAEIYMITPHIRPTNSSQDRAPSSAAPTAQDDRRNLGEPMNVRLLVKIAAVGLVLWVLSWVVWCCSHAGSRPALCATAAEFLPACVTTARRLRANPAVPRRAKSCAVDRDRVGALADRPHPRVPSGYRAAR